MKNYHIQGPQIHQFNNVQARSIPRSMFKRDYTRRMTFNQDVLVPIMIDEVLPGDDINIKMTAFCRMSTPIKPLMDNLYLETFWFFVPNRLVWDNWEKFQGQQTNPSDSVAFTIPKLNPAQAPISTTGFLEETLADYFGLPTRVTALDNISALPFRAYELIWNDWFRDESLQNSQTVPKGDGPDDPSIYTLLKRNKRKDYFTSCLPWPQKGAEISITFGGTAQVRGTGKTLGIMGAATGGGAIITAGLVSNGGTIVQRGADYDTNIGQNSVGAATMTSTIGLTTDGTKSGVVADLSTATPISINTLRQAALYQQILELDARGGTRYVESIYSRFGVVSPDFRLQRPELIGQGSTRINIYAVPQTSASPATPTSTNAQGNMAAYGTAAIQGDHGCRYSATEHGMLIALANVRADLTYQQGIPRMFTRRTRLDFYEPLLNGLGEQTVLNREIFAQGTAADLNVFGYQERFSEYRYRNSEICGKFRSNAAGTLNIWHLSQQFGALPALNSSFIEEAVPMARVLAVNTEPSFLMDSHFSYTHVRPMPIRSNPGIDRL
ncbi:major capsid protein [Apis mellifera associated microvirus 60]|nr:major capsid protein [Apis mellifera associated microvirus 60]AZL82894.1 major capsid protein [Apis mellifera associated microvirus 60]